MAPVKRLVDPSVGLSSVLCKLFVMPPAFRICQSAVHRSEFCSFCSYLNRDWTFVDFKSANTAARRTSPCAKMAPRRASGCVVVQAFAQMCLCDAIFYYVLALAPFEFVLATLACLILK
ncbi:hypothetical protein HAX54_040427 [Datura stramonium]|uniref:Uncharacterized protein n=1 Tax=Datura stramonium TaxID=4076 RepID=A0ABS8SK68_DATST|nr:hypothetical protein [Datura stramonium]